MALTKIFIYYYYSNAAEMVVQVPGLIAIVVSYLIVLVVGIWSGRKKRNGDDTNDPFLANRQLGIVISTFTISGTL